VLSRLSFIAAVERGPWGRGAVPAHQCDVARTRGVLGAYQASIPLLGPLCIPQRAPSPRGVGAVAFNTVVWPCWCWSSASSYNPGAPTIHPTSSCSSAWRWVLSRSSFVAAMEGGLWVVESFLRVSVTWRTHRGCWVLTGRVSPFWGLSASLSALLARVDSLTSRLNREEGVLMAVGVHCAFFIIAGCHQ
jgi:hypothetical protein